MGSREKSSRGSDSPRRPTRSGLRNFITSAVGRLRNSPERTFQRLDTQVGVRRNRDTELRYGIEIRIRAADTATEMHECAAVKSPLGAQTVLGDRHDLVCETLLQVPSAACGTRPRELSSGWVRKQMRDGI